MIDTHCHVFREYYNNIDLLIEKVKEAGVTKIIVNGCDMESNLEVLGLIKKYDIVYGAIGFHPTELEKYNNECISWLEQHIGDNKVVAIGEIGLDYHYDDTDKKIQKDIFKKQLELAQKHNKPVIIHTRDSIQDTYDILNEFNIHGSIHAFSGSLEMAKKFIKLGYYIGIGGVCTFNNAKNILEVIKNIPIEYILLETDSPYLSPVPYRGKQNTPANIPIIAKRISEIKNEELFAISNATTENAKRLFDF